MDGLQRAQSNSFEKRLGQDKAHVVEIFVRAADDQFRKSEKSGGARINCFSRSFDEGKGSA